ncbi:hypothetical protein [Streptomyces sp. NPDC001020]
MTQSGQGEEPSARPAHEGIVLPSDGHAAPAGGQAWGGPWGPGQPAQAPSTQTWGTEAGPTWGATGTQPSWEPAVPQPGWGGTSASQPQAAQGQPLPPEAPAGSGAGPLPPEGAPASPYGMNKQQAPQHAQPVPHAGPLPPADEGATQYIPPVAADDGATQYIPPVAPGGPPPAVPADDATRFLGQPVGSAPSAAGPDEQATQYLSPAPGGPGPEPYGAQSGAPGGDRQTPAEFDNLFRNDMGGAESTQQLPQFDVAKAPGAPVGRAAERRGGGGGGRPPSRVPLIAAVGVIIAVVGIGAGALLGAGGDSDSKNNDNKTVAATAPAEEPSKSASAPVDPAKGQAVALDKLLADSGNSRGAVIKAVADVGACRNLDQAATDLHNAAKQRNDLVTRLSGLQVDKLPNHGELTTALKSAWQASASADNHYAAWANQLSHKKKCKGAHSQRAAGDRASGTASAKKAQAAPLWNAIARKYGLTQRQPTQL